MNIRALGIASILSTLLPATGFAQEAKIGDIAIEAPWSRATPKGAPVAAGYLTIHNNGKGPDTLLGGQSDVAGDVQVHEMTMDGDVMKMRQLAKGLEIAPGASVELKPGGYHLMLMNLKQPLAQGQSLRITLNFEHAGKAAVDFKIGGIGDSGPAKAGEGAKMEPGMKGMGGGGMNMSH
jgi:copper(I)-binding protein